VLFFFQGGQHDVDAEKDRRTDPRADSAVGYGRGGFARFQQGFQRGHESLQQERVPGRPGQVREVDEGVRIVMMALQTRMASDCRSIFLNSLKHALKSLSF